ncbi:MAG: PEGA domain-containing protein [Polyangiaceae bacterium]|nr:PEGA domain-containing protein [Polyangiaceae bacterium]
MRAHPFLALLLTCCHASPGATGVAPSPGSKEETSAAATSIEAPARVSDTTPGGAPGPTEDGAVPGASDGKRCTVSLNSVPASAVVLDGRDVGSTPIVRVSVAEGPHGAQFSAPGLQRDVAFTCALGASQTIAVDLRTGAVPPAGAPAGGEGPFLERR